MFELLVRMIDEEGEIVPPMAFIPAAERYNLMSQVDRWVTRTALTTMAARRHPSREAENLHHQPVRRLDRRRALPRFHSRRAAADERSRGQRVLRGDGNRRPSPTWPRRRASSPN
jgi:EAL domain-containing protein (putative c-di-GMP-specific phosphodiesterase class I)